MAQLETTTAPAIMNPERDSEASIETQDATPPPARPQPARKGARFWLIMCVISLTGLLTALEATITSTVLPVIVAELGGADQYIWVANGYFLAMYVKLALAPAHSRAGEDASAGMQ